MSVDGSVAMIVYVFVWLIVDISELLHEDSIDYSVDKQLYVNCDAGYERSVEFYATCVWQTNEFTNAEWEVAGAVCKS